MGWRGAFKPKKFKETKILDIICEFCGLPIEKECEKCIGNKEITDYVENSD